ncbi:Stalked cell differentiation-controlling protein [Jannaschia seosinensis]|uniref:diguanylate cyclase n=1 Tax=Jannaschia seosinensis TaxID=313367 RepID=A0A0M7BBC9_9RHOB|nr:diguanylate cyclase [Jannaschia seosinensis]CUH39701.1 Stalked cell differentiation-controlling protein [Jannaschia seosinensis]
MSGRILIVDDVATNRIVMKVKLAAARYDVVPACSGAEAIEVASRGGIDLVIMDMMMPGMTGAEACRRLRAAPDTATIPVILVTASEDMQARMDGLSAGADDFLAKPVDEVALLARVRSLLRSREEERDFHARGGEMLVFAAGPSTQPFGYDTNAGFSEAGGQAAYDARPTAVDGRVAIIAGPEARWPAAQRERLAPLFRGGISTMDRGRALALSDADVPDLFLIDADLGARNDGLRLMSELRSRSATRHAAFIILLSEGDSERAATALDLGAADVGYHPMQVDEMAMRIRTQLSRKRRADKMRSTLDTGLKLAVIDPLTGLHNRRYGLHHLSQVAIRCRMQGIRAGVVLLDIDHFKHVNDTHGHPAGDQVLARIAQILKDSLRSEDLVARLGGEEFLAILPDADLDQVRLVAERLRQTVEAAAIPLAGTAPVSVTVSIGVGMLNSGDSDGSDTLARVDRALYAAKHAGRNRVNVAGEAAL